MTAIISSHGWSEKSYNQPIMKKTDIAVYFVISLIAIASRIPFVEHFQSHWDGPQYSIAVVRYSFEQQTPAPPGYPLYIALGKLFYLFLHDPHKAILAVSVLGSILGGIIFYFVGKNMYNRYVGIIASTLFFTGSTFYYFGLTAYAYELLPATTTLLAYVVYQITIKKKQYGLLLGIIFGICFGIRPQETIQIGLLPLLGFLLLVNKEKFKSILAFCIITFFWFIPMVVTMGGLQKYFFLSQNFAEGAFTPTPIKQHVELMIKGFFLSFGAASIFLLYYLTKLNNLKTEIIKHKKIFLFYIVWILPGVIFNLFIRTDHAGYQMSYLSGLVMLISYALWQMTRKNKLLLALTLIIVTVFNLSWFFYNRDPQYVKPYRPTSFHYSDIRKNDLKTGSKVNFVNRTFRPQSTLIVSTETLWRPYSYYLKNYSYIALFRLDNSTIPYSYNRIDSINWNINWYQDKKFTIVVPPHVSTVIFMDDDANTWIKNYSLKIKNLPGKSTVTIVSVQPGDKITYNYHELKVVKK